MNGLNIVPIKFDIMFHDLINKDNIPFKTISKYTKLSISKIKEIISSKNRK